MKKTIFINNILLLVLLSILISSITNTHSNDINFLLETNYKQDLDTVTNWKSIDHQFSRDVTSFSDIKFWNQTHGWIVGNNDTNMIKGDCFILNTVNGGLDWNIQYFNNSERLECIEIIDQDKIWVGGKEGLFYTINGGLNWKFCKIDEIGNHFNTIHFYNSTHGWAGGIRLYITQDGGSHWEEKSSINQILNKTILEFPRDVKFISSTEGWILTTGGTYYTDDAGLSWTQKYNQGGWIIHPINSENLWIAQDTSLCQSIDGGDSWRSITFATFYTNYYFTDIAFTDEDNGWAVGSHPAISYTPDGGKNWYEQEIDTELSIRAFSCFFFNRNVGWVVGSSGTILKSTNASYFNSENIRDQHTFSTNIEFYPSMISLIIITIISVLKRNKKGNQF